jgi:PPOX class probable F420-dependent enzyme
VIELSDAELEAFLAEPLVATLATYRRDGTVLLSPVWQEWRDGGFNVLVGGKSDIKSKHIRRDARVAIAVAEHEPPYRGVEAAGAGRLSEDGYADVRERLVARYLPAGAPSELGNEGLVLRLEPSRLRAWSFRDWFE